MVVKFETRVKLFEMVKEVAKNLIEGKINKTLKDVENEMFPEYLKSLKGTAPITIKRKIAKEQIKKDIQLALEEIQKEF